LLSTGIDDYETALEGADQAGFEAGAAAAAMRYPGAVMPTASLA